MKKLQLPYGVQDYTPKECYNKAVVQKKLSDTFESHGFERVETSTLEYYDLFDGVLDSAKINRMFKMTDNDGSLLVLRPDPTLQICRMAASKLDVKTHGKLYYTENSFEYLSDHTTARSREFSQAGVELLGTTGSEGDAEIITLAIEGLLNVGLTDFLIEIGQVRFFRGLMSECGVDDGDAKQLRRLVNNKDMLGVELFLQKRNASAEFISKFLLLPSLFGGTEVLEKAKKLCDNSECLAAIDDLARIMEVLKVRGLDKYVSIDLGMVQGDYYSGLVMRGVSRDLGVSLLDGGRYDTLGNAFNVPLQAVGFAIGVKRLLIALERGGKLVSPIACDYAYISDDSSKKVYEYVSGLRKQGKRVTRCFFETESELVEFCKAKGIAKALVFCGGKQKEIQAVREDVCKN